MGNQNGACCGQATTARELNGPSKYLLSLIILETQKNKKKQPEMPDLVANNKKQFMNLSQFECSGIDLSISVGNDEDREDL
jgi:hypothetical protein